MLRSGAGVREVRMAEGGGRRAVGVLIFIGVIVGLNVLSDVFDWGWIFY